MCSYVWVYYNYVPIIPLITSELFLCRVAAAYSLLQKKSRLFSLNSNNAVLEFFIEGAPEIVETHLDSKKVHELLLTCRSRTSSL